MNCERLQRYFEGDLLEQALEKYGTIWPLQDKHRLYERGNIAFRSKPNESGRQQAFEAIYDEFRRYWRVFRNAKSRWSSTELFDKLNSESVTESGAVTLTLVDLQRDRSRASTVRECVEAVRELKITPSGNSSAMAISKFLHAFNPKLFPIYDWQFVNSKVLMQFNRKLAYSTANGVDFYLSFVDWVCDVFPSDVKARTYLMATIDQWFSDQVRKELGSTSQPHCVEDYFATAFEFISVGAALHQESLQRQ